MKETKRRLFLLVPLAFLAGMTNGLLGAGGGIVLIILFFSLRPYNECDTRDSVNIQPPVDITSAVQEKKASMPRGGIAIREQKEAFAASCVCVFFFSAVSAVVYAHRGTLTVTRVLPFLIPAITGGALGAALLRIIRLSWLKTGFALLLLYGGLKTVLG